MSTADGTTPGRATTPVLPGVAAGAVAALAAMGVYQVVRLGLVLAGPTGAGGVDRFLGLLLLPALLSLGPCLVAGAVLGGLVGLVLTLSWAHQGLVRAALSGALVTAVVAGVINLAFVEKHRANPLTLAHWLHLLGAPSLLLVPVFAGVGAWLYRSQLRTVEA